jgi:hypothetical protein
MSTYRTRRLDRDTAERLLRGDPTGQAAPPQLAALLAAASAVPPAAGELAGEGAALAAFRAARVAQAGTLAAPSRARSARAKFFTIKVAVVTLATTSVLGGVALAAGTNTLPYQRKEAPPASVVPGPPASGQPTPKPSAAGPRATPGKPSDGAPPTTRPNAPSLVGRCRAYTARPPGQRGKALETPAFGALVTAAGGKERVAAYCSTILGPDSGKPGQGPDKPAHPGKPTKTHPAKGPNPNVP